MNSAKRFRSVLAATLSACAAQAAAQQDVQVTGEAITRACREIHRVAQAEEAPPSVGPQGNVVLNCRLIGPGGVTEAQVSPEEVCRRLTGSTEWYRGAVLQVYCRAGAGASQPGASTGARAPGDKTITSEDIARACQRTHRNPQAFAEPTTIGRYGVELNCRLINSAGFTLARVAPEDVCENVTGRREWYRGEGTEVICRGTPVAIGATGPTPPAPPGPPSPGPNLGPGPGSGAGGAPSSGGGEAPGHDVLLTSEQIARGCRALHGAASRGGGVKVAAPYQETSVECSVGGRMQMHSAAEFCPHISGTSGSYLSPKGIVCRGSGNREFEAFGDMNRFCRSKGFEFGNNGVLAARAPTCFNPGGGPMTSVALADVCQALYGTRAYGVRNGVPWCSP